MEEMIVYPYDIKVGDIIYGCKGPAMDSYLRWPDVVVTSAPVKLNTQYWEFSVQYKSGLTGKESKPSHFTLQIRRRSAGRSSSASTKHIDDFPSCCPLCGAKAYVSALAVAHKDEVRAKGCTARRV